MADAFAHGKKAMTMTNRRISLRELRTFCIAAEHESFREAAEKLFVTASAVSHQIKSLETELGKRLFERGPRALRLTTDGEMLYGDMQPLLKQIDEVSERHRSETPRSVLNISVQPFFASELFVPRLAGFRELHPDIDIVVETSDESQEKHPAAADASIRLFTSPPADLAHRRLFPLRFIPVGSPELYDRIDMRAGRIASDLPLIVHDSRPKAWQQWERSSGIRLPRNSSTVRMDSMIAVARAAERGLGAALFPQRLGDRWLKDGTLVPLFEHELEVKDAYYFAHRKELSMDSNVRLLEAWVLQEFAQST